MQPVAQQLSQAMRPAVSASVSTSTSIGAMAAALSQAQAAAAVAQASAASRSLADPIYEWPSKAGPDKIQSIIRLLLTISYGKNIRKSQENHGKHIRKSRPCLGYFHGKFMEIIGLKAPGNYPASIWFNIFRFAHGRTRNSSFL